jgi:hypothetical protein
MGWAVGYDTSWHRDIGYGVPATCDYPDCGKRIDRGLGYVCGGQPFGGEHGCGLYFCDAHMVMGEHQFICARCIDSQPPFEPTPDVEEWTHHKATDPSWAKWRAEQRAEREG